jgi:hypothetical protein
MKTKVGISFDTTLSKKHIKAENKSTASKEDNTFLAFKQASKQLYKLRYT